MFRSFGIGAVVSALFLAACGSGGTSGSTSGTGGAEGVGGAGSGSTTTTTTSGGSGATVDTACEAWTKAYCDKLASCYPFILNSAFPDAATCAARNVSSCKAKLSLPEASPTNAAKYQACAAKFASLSCDVLLLGDPPEDCQPDPGTLAEGKPCGDNAQCASTYCKGDAGACGVCAAMVAAGGACTPADKCAHGLVCGGNTCVPPSGLGAACSNQQPCAAPLQCSNMKCVKPGAVGDACSSANPMSCDPYAGAYCNPATSKCELIKTAMVGEACGLISNSIVTCSGGAYCNNGMNAMGTCVAPAADGEACGSNGIVCQNPANCVNGVCMLPIPPICK